MDEGIRSAENEPKVRWKTYAASQGELRLEIELTAQAEPELVAIGDFSAKDNPSAAQLMR